MLTTIKKIVFLSRQGYEIFSKTHNNHPDTTRSQQQYDLASSLILIVKWLIVQEYHPQIHGFKVICENDIENISCDLLFGKQMADGTFHAIDNFLQEEKNSGKLENHINAGRINYVKVSAALNLRGSEIPFIASKRLQLALAKYETRILPEKTDPSYTINRKQYQSARSKHYRDAYGQPISYSSL